MQAIVEKKYNFSNIRLFSMIQLIFHLYKYISNHDNNPYIQAILLVKPCRSVWPQKTKY